MADEPGQQNRREAFRADMSLPARIGRQSLNPGRWRRCTVLNLSAAGVLLAAPEPVDAGAEVMVDVPLAGELAEEVGSARLRLRCEVIESGTELPDGAATDGRHSGATFLRLRHLAAEGDDAYEAVRKAVFARQRADLAERSGMDGASPMAVDAEERAARRSARVTRFSDRSVGRPGSE